MGTGMEELTQEEKNIIAIKLETSAFALKEGASLLDHACDDSFVASNMRNTARIINAKIKELIEQEDINGII